jgi:hypothetical protein
LLIENFYCRLKKKWWTKEDSSTVSPENTARIRRCHLELLKKYRPDYYPAFQQREANNLSSVLPLTEQLLAHGLPEKNHGLAEKSRSLPGFFGAPASKAPGKKELAAGKDELNFNIRKGAG